MNEVRYSPWKEILQVYFRDFLVFLLDHDRRWEELEASANPFAAVVMIYLKTQATRRDEDARLRWKVRLVRHLYDRGFERQDVELLFRFIDWLMGLPEELEERFDVELRRIEGETGMRYVTRFEQRAIDRGREQGIQLGRQEGREEGLHCGLEEGVQLGERSLLKRQLRRRFVGLPGWAEQRLDKACRQQLELWADRVLDAEVLEDVFGSP